MLILIDKVTVVRKLACGFVINRVNFDGCVKLGAENQYSCFKFHKMAKNTSSSAFRKIDVDQYNEDNFKEDEGDQGGQTGPNEAEILTLLNQGKHAEALRTVLSSAPLGSKSQQTKDHALTVTLRVLLSIKASQIDEIVQSLNPELIDVLMKYVYRGFEIPSEGSSGHLLLWHEKAYNIGGVGCIVRVLSDSKRA